MRRCFVALSAAGDGLLIFALKAAAAEKVVFASGGKARLPIVLAPESTGELLKPATELRITSSA